MNFIRSFFTSAVKLSPEARMANVKEVQRIIDNNNVGEFSPANRKRIPPSLQVRI